MSGAALLLFSNESSQAEQITRCRKNKQQIIKSRSNVLKM